MCISYSATCLLPPLLNIQVAVYKFSLWNWLFERECLSILLAINTGYLILLMECTYLV